MTMGDLVSFPRHNKSIDQGASSENRRIHRPAISFRRKRMRNHVEGLIKQFELGRLPLRSADLLVVAGNMRRITQRAREEHNLKQEQIYAVTTRDRTNGAKASQNAYYYEAPPGSTTPRRITKKPLKHIKLLQHIADITKVDFIDLVQEWLAGTTILQRNEAAKGEPDEPDHADKLLYLINRISQRLDHDCDLADYLKRLGRGLVSYDVRADVFYKMEAYDTSLGEIHWDPDPNIPWEVCSDEAPPWPSVGLLQERLTPAFPGCVRHAPDVPERIMRIDRGGRPWALSVAPELAASIAVDASLWSELRLALAPVAPHGGVTPVFELRFKTRYHDGKGYLRILNEYTYWQCDGNIGGIYIEDQWRPAVLEIDIPENHWHPRVLRANDQFRIEPSEYCYFHYLPVTSQTCRAILDRPSQTAEYLIGEPFTGAERLQTFFPHHHLGARIEALILYPDQIGVDLTTELKRDAKEKIARFNEVYWIQIDEIEAAHKSAHARLLNTDTPNERTP
jgi:hypothetical protein